MTVVYIDHFNNRHFFFIRFQLMDNLELNNQSELYDRLQDIMTGMPDD